MLYIFIIFCTLLVRKSNNYCKYIRVIKYRTNDFYISDICLQTVKEQVMHIVFLKFTADCK